MLQPVNRLPPEIISRVAQHASRAGIDTRWIVPLTHVCRYWRESIISTPEVWTSISSYQKGLAILSLERSKAAPLQLFLDIGTLRRDPELGDLILSHIQNTETLMFGDFPTIEDLTQTLPNFPQSMPNLRSLTLERSRDDPEWDSSTDPFELFPHTLRSLWLMDIPLYPSFLKLRTLTKLFLQYNEVRVSLDAVLDVFEENRSLESVNLGIESNESPICTPQRRVAIMSRLQHWSIACRDAMVIRTLISSVALQSGARLGINLRGENGLNDILSGISTTHLSNLSSPTFMEYHSNSRGIRLVGPNGSFSYHGGWPPAAPFAELPILPLTNVQELHLVHGDPSIAFHPSLFPALKTLTIGWWHTDIPRLFFALFPNPSSFCTLKTIGFLDCVLTEEFMEELMWFASDRKNTTSAWLHRVVIVHPYGKFPTADSIYKLRSHVPVVDIQFGRSLPKDLT